MIAMRISEYPQGRTMTLLTEDGTKYIFCYDAIQITISGIVLSSVPQYYVLGPYFDCIFENHMKQ